MDKCKLTFIHDIIVVHHPNNVMVAPEQILLYIIKSARYEFKFINFINVTYPYAHNDNA